MRYLQRSMRTRVGTPGRNDCDTLACDLRQRALESILHSAAVRLGLPAVKRRAVVFESERDAHIRGMSSAGVRRAVRSPPYCDARKHKGRWFADPPPRHTGCCRGSGQLGVRGLGVGFLWIVVLIHGFLANRRWSFHIAHM